MLRKDPLFVLRGRLVLSLGQPEAAEAILKIEASVQAEVAAAQAVAVGGGGSRL